MFFSWLETEINIPFRTLTITLKLIAMINMDIILSFQLSLKTTQPGFKYLTINN